MRVLIPREGRRTNPLRTNCSPHSLTRRKMAARWLFLVCAAASVPFSVDGQGLYNELSPNYREGVDLALQQLRSHAGVHHHFLFLRSLDKSDIESGFGVKYLYHHFYVKPTWCAKNTNESDPRICPFRNDRPLMDCAICYKTLNERMETLPRPYIHCIQKPRLTEKMKITRLEHCKKMSYNSGAPTLLSVSTG